MEQGDAISRSAVLEMLSDEFNSAKEYFELTTFEYRRALYLGKMNCSTRAKRKVTELPALDAVPAEQGKWISIKDRLPEDGEAVLTCKNGLVEVQVYEKKRNGWINGDWFWSMATVTHWMPLPEPPKEGRDEQHPDGL